jgi:hypothetical protein
MADPAEFSPVELDRMEDALETIELADVHDEPSIAVRRRLQDYRQILALSRAAMPMVEVPRGLLENVLAEARVAAELPVVEPAVVEPPRASAWTRIRRMLLLPGVALAAAAALVLIMVDRDDKASSQSPVIGAAQQAAGDEVDRAKSTAISQTKPAAEARFQEPPPPPPAGPAPAGGVAAPDTPTAAPITATPPAEAASKEQEERANGDADLGYEKAEKKKEADDKSATKSGALADEDATPRWDIIARGDRARHKNDCEAARSEYTLALDDLDARVRARAHAGLGLCDAVAGRRSAADAAYKQARELDAEIVQFIDDERPRGGGSSNAAKAQKKPKAAPPAQSALESDDRAFDPFGN